MAELIYSKKQITPLVEKYKIDVEKNSTFREIIEMFDGQTNYQIWAIKLIFNNIIKLNQLREIKQFADENQTLISKLEKQNLVSYSTKSDINQLNLEIGGAIAISFVKRCINQFNTRQRDMLTEYVFGKKTKGQQVEVTPMFAATDSTFKKHVEFFKKFDGLNATRKHQIIVTESAANDVKELIARMNSVFEASYIWEKEDLLYFIANNKNCKGVNIIFNSGNYLVLEIPNFTASHTICYGRTEWCLTREQSYWNNYVGKVGNRQFFYFDFSKPEKDNLSHIGFTVNKTNGIVDAHSTSNKSMIHPIEYNGKWLSVHDVLRNANIDSKLFIHLNKIPFNWSNDDVIAYIASKCKHCEVVFSDRNYHIVKCFDSEYDNLCGHTLVNKTNIIRSENVIYTIFNMNVASNDDLSTIVMVFKKDKYGSLSMQNMYDAYGVDVSKKNILSQFGIAISSFINNDGIEPSILLHKYIDEGCELDAVNLIKKNPNGLDVNYELNYNAPIFTAMEKGMFSAVESIISHPTFNNSITNGYEEPLVQSLIYDYVQYCLENKSKSTKKTPLHKMMETIIALPNYDLNSVNMNLDSPIMVAAEFTETAWVFDMLVQNPNVNINLINDVNRSALGNAIYKKNIHAITALAKRADLVVREEDYQLATSANIDLKGILEKNKPTSMVSDMDAAFKEAFSKTFA